MRRRIIDQLRKVYPGKWIWDRDRNVWHGPIGTVHAQSRLTPKHDGDDETCITEYVDQEGKIVGIGRLIFSDRGRFNKWDILKHDGVDYVG